MMGMVDDIGLILSGKLAIRTKQIWLIHRPLLGGSYFLVTVVMAVGSPSHRIESISIWMQVVPGCQLSRRNKVTLIESTVGAVCLMSEPHWMFIEFCHRHHPIEVSVIWKVVLNRKCSTALVVTP